MARSRCWYSLDRRAKSAGISYLLNSARHLCWSQPASGLTFSSVFPTGSLNASTSCKFARSGRLITPQSREPSVVIRKVRKQWLYFAQAAALAGLGLVEDAESDSCSFTLCLASRFTRFSFQSQGHLIAVLECFRKW